MAERASVVEHVQIGVQTDETLVAGTKLLGATTIRLDPDGVSDEFRPEGQKDYTLVTPTGEWSTGSIEGRLTFDEFGYPLSMHYGSPVAKAITDAALVAIAGAYGYEWTATQTTLDVPKKLTIERGSSFRAHRAGSAVAPDLGYSIAPKEAASISGSLLAKRIEDGITLTSSPTPVLYTPLLPPVDVYLDTTAAGIGTTKLTKTSKVEWKRNGKWKDYWVLDTAQPSFVDTVETAPDATMALTMQSDPVGAAMHTRWRAGTTAFIRIQRAGPQLGVAAGGWKIGGGTTISGNATYLFRHDLAVKVQKPVKIEDQNAVMGQVWPLRVVYDATLGFSERITLVNATAAY